MVFTCPRCSRTKDFSGIYIPPLGRSYRCPCGLSTLVRPTWVAGGQKALTSGAKEPPPPDTQKPIALPAEKVKERLTASAPVVRTPQPPAPSAPPPVPPAPPAAAKPASAPSEATIDRLFPATTWSPDSGEKPIAPKPAPPAEKPAPPPPPPAISAEIPPDPPPKPVRQIVPNPDEFKPDAPTRRQVPLAAAPVAPLAPILEPKTNEIRPAAPAAPPPPAPDDEDLTGPMPRAPMPSLGGQHALGAAALAPEAPAPAAPSAPAPAGPPARPEPLPHVPAIEVRGLDDVSAPAERASIPAKVPAKDDDDWESPEHTEPGTRAPSRPRPSGGKRVPIGLVDVGPTPPDVTDPAPAAPAQKPAWRQKARSFALRAGLAIVVFAAALGFVEYRAMVHSLPPIDSIKNYRPPIVTEVRTKSGTLVGKFYKEERYVVAMEDIPQHVKQAFLASEDAGFYEHNGVDGKSIARAILKNLLEGRSAQGGSTITQQVARTFVLTREKTYRRKVAEIMLARKLEAELSKDEILHRYLNQIFFGHGAYGVEAAARIHFGKHVGDLTIAEAALLAGLPQAPSRYAPRNNPDAALARRHYVLGEMLANRFITKKQYEEADKAPLTLGTISDPTKTMAPFVTEQIRRELFEDFGAEAVLTQGLQVVATLDTAMQFAAQKAVNDGLVVLDKRIGYRPLAEKVEPAKFDEAAKTLGEKAPAAGEVAKGIVEEQGQDRAWVRLPGGARGVVFKTDNPWAYPVVPEAYFKTRKVDDLGRVLKKGDVVRVRVLNEDESKGLAEIRRQKKPDEKLKKKLQAALPLALVQDPEVEGSLLSFTIPEGRVLAMVGGSDFSKSEFLRPMQSRRQVGSTFKTMVYAAALSKKPPPGTPKNKQQRFTLATILQDAPVVMQAKEAELASAAKKRRASDEGEEQWKPGNSGDKYYGDTPLRTAYILSRNVPTLALAQKIGVREIISFAKKMGIESDLPPDLSIALGTASLTLFEITRAHAAFPAGGVAVDPRFIERVVDRDGAVLYDLQSELASKEAVRLVDEKTAFVMTQLMLDVARAGTASEVGRHIKKATGGKTGTTNDYIDAWYVGFTPRVMTGVWVGYDQVRSLGVGETGAEAALPIWIEYTKAAVEKYPDGRFVPPEGVLKMKVDRATGKRAGPGQKPEEVVETWFVKGTEPTEVAQVGKIRDEPNLFEIDPGLR